MCCVCLLKNKTLTLCAVWLVCEKKKNCTNILMVFIKDFMRSIILSLLLHLLGCTRHSLHPFLLAVFSLSFYLICIYLLCLILVWLFHYVFLMIWFVIKTTSLRTGYWCSGYWCAHKIYHYLRSTLCESQCDARRCYGITKCHLNFAARENDKIKTHNTLYKNAEKPKKCASMWSSSVKAMAAT